MTYHVQLRALDFVCLCSLSKGLEGALLADMLLCRSSATTTCVRSCAFYMGLSRPLQSVGGSLVFINVLRCHNPTYDPARQPPVCDRALNHTAVEGANIFTDGILRRFAI